MVKSLSFSIPEEEWCLARGAYLGRTVAAGPAVTFTEWVWLAIQAFALRTSAERACWVDSLGAVSPRPARTVPVDQEILEVMAEAVAIDARMGRGGNRSAWVRAALRAAVQVTAEHDGEPVRTFGGRAPPQRTIHGPR